MFIVIQGILTDSVAFFSNATDLKIAGIICPE
jgi:hypothetical protein